MPFSRGVLRVALPITLQSISPGEMLASITNRRLMRPRLNTHGARMSKHGRQSELHLAACYRSCSQQIAPSFDLFIGAG
jgi:hypothetical protein